MKENIKESLQFILQHPAIGSPLVQHAQNLARHVTSQHYEAMTANEEYPSGSDNGLQWVRDLETSPQVTDEKINPRLEAIRSAGLTQNDAIRMFNERNEFYEWPDDNMRSAHLNQFCWGFFDAIVCLLSAPPAAETQEPSHPQFVAGFKAGHKAGRARGLAANQEARPVAAIPKLPSYPDMVRWDYHMPAPVRYYTEANVLALLAAAPQEQAPADRNAILEEAAAICDGLRCRPEFEEELQDRLLRQAGDKIRALQSQPQQVTKGGV